MKAIIPKETWEYVPDCDKALPENEQTKFILKPMTAAQHALYDDNAAQVVDGKYLVRHGTQNLMLLNFGIESVHNFNDEKGNPIQVERDEHRAFHGVNPLTEDFLKRIPRPIQVEIAGEIYAGNIIGEEEVKN